MNELEETGSMEPLHTATHEITFDNVDFAYVPGEPVLKHVTHNMHQALELGNRTLMMADVPGSMLLEYLIIQVS